MFLWASNKTLNHFLNFNLFKIVCASPEEVIKMAENQSLYGTIPMLEKD